MQKDSQMYYYYYYYFSLAGDVSIMYPSCIASRELLAAMVTTRRSLPALHESS